MNQFKPANPADATDRRTDGNGGAAHQDDMMCAGEDAVQRAIGSQLRAVYDEVVSLPVPDKFLALLSSLDAMPTAASGPGRDNES